MKKFDVKKAIEFCNGFKSCIDEERNIAYVVRMILKGGLVEDEAVKEDYKCPFSETTMCNENKRAGCEMRTEWFQNGGVGWETSSVKECEPDPILEVYDKFIGKFNISEDFWGLTYDNLRSWWQAIEKYAKGKGKHV